MHFKLTDENGFVRYDDEVKKYINITASLTYFDSSAAKNVISFSRNYKKVRLCIKKDFERVDFLDGFEEDQENNFDLCIDNYDGMVITNNQQ